VCNRSSGAKLARKLGTGVSKPLRAVGVVVAGTLRTGVFTPKTLRILAKEK